MTQPTGAVVAMSKHEFELLRDLIRDRCGLSFTDETAYLMERRLMPRLGALGMRRFSDYLAYLGNPALSPAEFAHEVDEVFDRLATRETYFFRESYQLDALRDHLLPRLHRDKPRGKTLRLWSAGCASGEETYTLAIQVLQSGLFADWDVRIVGSDLSHSALAIAQKGLYGPSSFRDAEGDLRSRYFHAESGRFSVDEKVRSLCTFTRCNLAQADFAGIDGPFDAIFCRNVIIYFERPARLRLLDGLAKKLAPGGVLFLGHSESLLDLRTPFALTRLGGELVYVLSTEKGSG